MRPAPRRPRGLCRQLWLSALPFALMCLASVLLVYTRSPLVSEMLGDAQLLCEIAKQRGGLGVFPLCLQYRWYLLLFVCVCVKFLTCALVSKCVCVLTVAAGTLARVPVCSCVISFLHNKVSPVMWLALPWALS